MNKTCPNCGKTKFLKSFYKDKSKKSGIGSWCKICIKKNNVGKPINREQIRKYQLKKNYGITCEQYDRMVEIQNSKCAICGLPEINRRLSVDHNHKTGKVRSLLCANCNARLGVVEDKDFNKKAKQYLRRYSN